MSPMKVICPLHGIRTLAAWQRGLSDLAGRYGWACRLEHWSYGCYSLLGFFAPWSREAKLGWFRRQYDAEMQDRRLRLEQGQVPSVVAHSFGTYILGYALLRFDFIRFNKVILCGSILPTDFPWDRLIDRGQVQAVRNEYGVRDPWVRRVRWFVRGTGPSGASGFTCRHDRLEQEEFEYDHGDYFGKDHMEDRWIPFLDEPLAEIPRAQDKPPIPRPQTSTPWGLYGLVLVVVQLAMVLSGLLIWTGYVTRTSRRPTPAQPPGLEIRGVVFSIENGQADRKYLPNVRVMVAEYEASDTTNDQGRFRIQLPAGVLPGQDVTLQEDLKDYYILLPVLGKVRVPATPAQVVEVWMAPKGSKVLLGANFIEQFIAYTADDSAKKPKDPMGDVPDLSWYVNELARQSGRPAEEIRTEIGRWVAEAKESDDPRKLGLAAFAEKKFRLAGKTVGRLAGEEQSRGAEWNRKSAANRELSGDFYSNASNVPDLREALTAYQAASSALKVYHDGLGELKLKVYPEYASDVRNLLVKLANVKIGLGVRVAGHDSQRYLDQAVQECRKLIEQIPKSSNPQDWAATQNYLGIALRSVGERQGGAEGARRLEEAVEAFRLALTVRTRGDLPQDWAATQNNLGNALGSLGEWQGGAEGARQLAEAVEAYRQALTVYTRDDLPQDWAMTQNNLGAALGRLGERQGGAEGARQLTEAVEAFRQALTVRTRDGLPRQWATTQNNFGIALQVQIRLDGFPKGLERIDRLSQAEGIRNDTVALASLRTLAVFCLVAADQMAEARRALASLVGLIEQQPDDFCLVWDWSRLRTLLEESQLPTLTAHRRSLEKLIDAVSRDNKAAILAGLDRH
jgi:tetratricopeptide (TPR) repeat protein